MALREGELRKNGVPARKSGYKAGNPPEGAGRPRRKECGLPDCHESPLPTYIDGTGKKRYPQFCSIEHRQIFERAYHLQRTYGLSADEYARLLVKQGGVCAICGSDNPGTGNGPRKRGRPGKHFAVDHDHKTGAVRGLLCGWCNRMIGQARDDTERMRRGIIYLESFK